MVLVFRGNSIVVRGDLHRVRQEPTCAEVEEALSAALDGEDTGLPAASVEQHIARCDACRAFGEAARALHAAVRVRAAPLVPDRTRSILSAVRAADRAPLWLLVRVLLAIVAVVEGAIFVPALLYGDDGEVPTHAARHLGAFGVAFAVALIVVAVRPRQARGLVPMTVTLTVAMIVAATVDTINGKTSPFLEAHHLLEVFGTALVWLLAVPASWPRREARSGGRVTQRRLRIAPGASSGSARMDRAG